MDRDTAEKIINEYGSAIADIAEGDMVQDVFKLPYSPGRIRYAFFVYAESLIEAGLFDDEISNQLTQTYALLDTRFVEDPEPLNKALKIFAHDEKAFEYVESRGGLTATMPSIEKMIEFQNFIADCYGNRGMEMITMKSIEEI